MIKHRGLAMALTRQNSSTTRALQRFYFMDGIERLDACFVLTRGNRIENDTPVLTQFKRSKKYAVNAKTF